MTEVSNTLPTDLAARVDINPQEDAVALKIVKASPLPRQEVTDVSIRQAVAEQQAQPPRMDKSRAEVSTGVAVSVRTLDGKEFKLTADPEETVGAFKERLATRSEVPVTQQRLLCKGVELDDDSGPIAQAANRQGEVVLFLVVRFPGSSLPEPAEHHQAARIHLRGTITIPVPEREMDRVVSNLLGNRSNEYPELLSSVTPLIQENIASLTQARQQHPPSQPSRRRGNRGRCRRPVSWRRDPSPARVRRNTTTSSNPAGPAQLFPTSGEYSDDPAGLNLPPELRPARMFSASAAGLCPGNINQRLSLDGMYFGPDMGMGGGEEIYDGVANQEAHEDDTLQFGPSEDIEDEMHFDGFHRGYGDEVTSIPLGHHVEGDLDLLLARRGESGEEEGSDDDEDNEDEEDEGEEEEEDHVEEGDDDDMQEEQEEEGEQWRSNGVAWRPLRQYLQRGSGDEDEEEEMEEEEEEEDGVVADARRDLADGIEEEDARCGKRKHSEMYAVPRVESHHRSADPTGPHAQPHPSASLSPCAGAARRRFVSTRGEEEENAGAMLERRIEREIERELVRESVGNSCELTVCSGSPETSSTVPAVEARRDMVGAGVFGLDRYDGDEVELRTPHAQDCTATSAPLGTAAEREEEEEEEEDASSCEEEDGDEEEDREEDEGEEDEGEEEEEDEGEEEGPDDSAEAMRACLDALSLSPPRTQPAEAEAEVEAAQEAEEDEAAAQGTTMAQSDEVHATETSTASAASPQTPPCASPRSSPRSSPSTATTTTATTTTRPVLRVATGSNLRLDRLPIRTERTGVLGLVPLPPLAPVEPRETRSSQCANIPIIPSEAADVVQAADSEAAVSAEYDTEPRQRTADKRGARGKAAGKPNQKQKCCVIC